MRKRLLWTVRDSYNDYLQTIEDSISEDESVEDSVFYIDYKSYKEIILDSFKEIALSIIKNRLNFKIPSRLGYLGIKKEKNTYDKRKPKFDVFNKTGKVVPHTNLHTNGYFFFHHWDKMSGKYAYFTNMSFYVFKPNRGNKGEIGKRGLSKHIKKCSTDPNMKDYDAPEIYRMKY